MGYKYSEVEFISLACQKLTTRYRNNDIYLGVPCLNRCIDVVINAPEGLIAIEFKIKNWKKAVEQTKDHLLGVDYAVICIPPKRIISNIESALEGTPLGLWVFDPDSQNEWPFTEIVSPRKSHQKWDVAEKWIYQRIEKGDFQIGIEV